MSSAARWALILIVLFVVLAMGIALLLLWAVGGGGGSLGGSKPVLAIQLDGAIPELKPNDPWTRLAQPELFDLRDVRDGLEQAASDSGIEGVFVEIGAPAIGWAQVEELRGALARFRASGKWVECYMETAGEFSGGNGPLMLGTACSTLTMSPPGDVGLVALRVETPFVRGMFDKLGVTPEFGQRKEFKNAANTYTHSDYTPPHREATLALLTALNDELVAAIATGRNLEPAQVRTLIDRGPYIGPEALQLGLVDALEYRDQVRQRLVDQFHDEHPFVTLHEYLQHGRPHSSGSETIALVYGLGGVTRGPSSGGNPFAGESMGSDTVVEELRRARQDDDVVAVVFRVDSPGGSYVASDLIRREVELLKAKKPIVISMGNYAASGGYFVAMDSSYIVANAATLTGSIGVFSGKMITRQFWEEKTGIHWGAVSLGESSAFYSSQEPYGEHGTERMNAMLDRIYDDFVTKAANGRGMRPDQLEPLAHGRVWTGRAALDRKLVDEVGGMHEAIAAAARLANVDLDDVRLQLMRKEASFFERVGERSVALFGGASPETVRVLRLISGLATPQPAAQLLDPALPELH